jgi:hypothetical protein
VVVGKDPVIFEIGAFKLRALIYFGCVRPFSGMFSSGRACRNRATVCLTPDRETKREKKQTRAVRDYHRNKAPHSYYSCTLDNLRTTWNYLLLHTSHHPNPYHTMSLPSPTTNRSGVPMQMDPQELEAMDVSGECVLLLPLPWQAEKLQVSAGRRRAHIQPFLDLIHYIKAPLIALTNQCQGDLRKLLFCFFSFLNRRTDFYLVPPVEDINQGMAKMGFPEGDAEKLLLAAFRQFPLRRIPRKKAAGPSQSTTSITDISTPAAAAKKDNANTASDDAAPVKDASKVVASTKVAGGGGHTETPTETKKASAEPSETPQDAVRLTEEGLQIPVGNGGSTKRYKWTQTTEECSVLIGIPSELRAKDLSVTIKASSVVVRTKKPMPGESEVRTFLEGDLADKAVPDESTWTLEGGVMVIQLYKQLKTFWKTIMKGDDEIDTTLVDSRRKIGEYDESTQAQIRKIMFDQNQARKGLPVSDPVPGAKSKIPPLPAGVEYIDQDILDEKTGFKR